MPPLTAEVCQQQLRAQIAAYRNCQADSAGTAMRQDVDVQQQVDMLLKQKEQEKMELQKKVDALQKELDGLKPTTPAKPEG